MTVGFVVGFVIAVAVVVVYKVGKHAECRRRGGPCVCHRMW